MPYIQNSISFRLCCILVLKQDIYKREACHIPTKACGKTQTIVRQNFYFAGSLFNFKHLAQLLRNQSASAGTDKGSTKNLFFGMVWKGWGFYLFFFFYFYFFQFQLQQLAEQSLQYPWELGSFFYFS